MSRQWPFDPFERGPFQRRPPSVQEVRLPDIPRRFWFGAGIIGLALLLLLLTQPIVDFWTDLLWFGGLGLQQVFLTRAGLGFSLFLGSLLVTLAFGLANVMLALRLRGGALRTIGIRRRYLRTTAGWVSLAAVAFVALVVSASASDHWNELALFTHFEPAGRSDPVFGQDVAFYLLTLPFLHSLLNWALAVVFLVGLVAAGLYVWRGDHLDVRLSRLAVAHLSGLLACLGLLVAISAWISRYDYVYGHNGFVWGPGFADVNARIPLTTVAAGLALLLALALAANVGLRRPAIPLAAAAVWVGFGILSGVYAAAVQRLDVAPAELMRERPYIQREIQFTRLAYGLDQVNVRQYAGNAPLTSADIGADQATINNLRLWDYRPLLDTYTQLQSIRTYYSFNDVDLDRYTLGNRYQQLELSARELDTSKLPDQAQTWVNQRLKYTHGYGIAASPVNAVVGEGVPDYVARDIPMAGSLTVNQPDIYFGETPADYVLAPSAEKEFDYPQGGQDVYSSYQGSHGVRMDGLARALFSLRTRDFNLLISPEIEPQTQILFRRNIIDRINEIAPFLSYDQDPYIVASGGRLYWLIDAYTTASTYPYSVQEADGENYIRNSVKVVIDAYEGTVDFYVNDPRDPLVRSYAATFPTLFKPLSAMPADLQLHLRVPEQLFSIQADVYRTYHMSDPQVFYNREDVWAQPLEQTSPNAEPAPLAPFYVLMRLPGESAPEYLLILPFTPNNKQNMIAELAARCDPPHRGELVSIVLPKDTVVFGPQQISRRIYETPQISRDFTLLGQIGSSIVQGNLLVVPVGDSFLYFEPVYLRANGDQSLPELKKVILADSSQVVYADTLAQALAQLAGAPAPAPNGGGPSLPSSASAQLRALAAQALQDYNAAQAKLRAGDLAGYAQEIQAVGQLLQQIQSGSGASPSPSPSPSP